MSKALVFLGTTVICVIFWLAGYTSGYESEHKAHYTDGALVCVVAGQPDVLIESPKILYLGDGKWKFMTGTGEFTTFEKGSMSSCFAAPKLPDSSTDHIDRDAPATPPSLDDSKINTGMMKV